MHYGFARAITLIFRLFFYGILNFCFPVLMIMTVLLIYFLSALAMGKFGKRKRAFLLIGLISNFSIPDFFESFNFFTKSTASIVNASDYSWNPTLQNILLPMRIKFYTLHTQIYIPDQNRIPETHNLPLLDGFHLIPD